MLRVLYTIADGCYYFLNNCYLFFMTEIDDLLEDGFSSSFILPFSGEYSSLTLPGTGIENLLESLLGYADYTYTSPTLFEVLLVVAIATAVIRVIVNALT